MSAGVGAALGLGGGPTHWPTGIWGQNRKFKINLFYFKCLFMYLTFTWSFALPSPVCDCESGRCRKYRAGWEGEHRGYRPRLPSWLHTRVVYWREREGRQLGLSFGGRKESQCVRNLKKGCSGGAHATVVPMSPLKLHRFLSTHFWSLA